MRDIPRDHRDDGCAVRAAAIALAAGRLAWVMAGSLVAGMTLDELHDRQIGWAQESAAGLAEWMRKKAAALIGDERDALMAKAAGVEGHWPIRPRGAE